MVCRQANNRSIENNEFYILYTVLGFDHMDNSYDRDEYVRIHWENIMEGKRKFFQKTNDVDWTRFRTKYDYDSLMHHEVYEFSKNKEPTVVPIVSLDSYKPQVGG